MLSLRIALRYLVAKKSHTAVNVITAVSMAGITVATMAMVVVLSIFNGFSDLSAAHLSLFDPELMVENADGGILTDGDSVAAVCRKIEGVATASPVVKERGLLVNGDAQCPVIFKAVADDYDARSGFNTAIIDGKYATKTYTDLPAVQLAVGVANQLLAVPSAENVMQLYVPRRLGRINPANPATAFNAADVAASAVFKVDQRDIDADYVIIPLTVGRQLLDYDAEANAVEISLQPGADVSKVSKAISKALPECRVLTRPEQRADAFRMISVEKWVTFMMMIFILVIALFNIVSTLSLLIIEKRTNMATLRALGADKRLVRGIFVAEGWLVTAAGGVIGMVLGIALTLAQQYGKIIKLSGDPSQLVIDSYPVRLDPADLLIVMAVVAATGFVASSITTLIKK